jgi:hypothetical protein
MFHNFAFKQLFKLYCIFYIKKDKKMNYFIYTIFPIIVLIGMSAFLIYGFYIVLASKDEKYFNSNDKTSNASSKKKNDDIKQLDEKNPRLTKKDNKLNQKITNHPQNSYSKKR